MFLLLDTLERDLRRLVTDTDPAAMTPVDAADTVEALARIARIATTGATRLAHRAGDATHWRRKRRPDIGAWLGGELGLSFTDGRRLHAASSHPHAATDTWALMCAGTIAPLAGAEIILAAVATDQARCKAEADAERRRQDAAAAPEPPTDDDPGGATAGEAVVDTLVTCPTGDDTARELNALAQDPTGSLHRVREARQRLEAATRDPDAQAKHLHATRHLRFRSFADGSVGGEHKLPPTMAAAIHAAIEAETQRLFLQRRAGGRREPREALLADALFQLITGTAAPPPPADEAAQARPGPARRASGPATRTRVAPTRRTGGAGSRQTAGTRPSGRPSDDVRPATTDPPPPPTTDPAPAGDGEASGLARPAPTDPAQLAGDDAAPAALPLDDAAPGPPVRRRGHVVVRVDATALHRGLVLPGEVCEIVGTGPIPVSDSRRLLSHATIDLVLHDGVRTRAVACTKRRLSRVLGQPAEPPAHSTRAVIRLDIRRLRPAGTGPIIDLPGTGPLALHALTLLLGARAVDVLQASAVDPWTIRTDGRTYPAAFLVAFREEQPVCVDCGNSRWLERDHDLALALGGVTTLSNLRARCSRCHREKTTAEAPRTIRASRRRRKERRGTSRQPRAPSVAVDDTS